MFDSFKRASEDAQELNLIPVMNLFMVLIPFLLMGAAFYHIGVVPVSTPTHDPQESDVPKTPKTVTVNLALLVDKVQLSLASTSLTEEELLSLSAEWPAPKGKYDSLAIQNKLIELKEMYPESNTIIVVPHDGLDYQTLVAVLDDTRTYPPQTMPDGSEGRPELFPVTVFSRFIPPSAEPDPGDAEPIDDSMDFDDAGDAATTEGGQ